MFLTFIPFMSGKPKIWTKVYKIRTVVRNDLSGIPKRLENRLEDRRDVH